MKIDIAIDEFILDKRCLGSSEKTIDYYRYCLDKLITVTKLTDLEQISLDLCKHYYIELYRSELSSVSVQSYFRGLRSFLTWCYDNEYISENIPLKLKLPKAQRKIIDVLTDNEIKRLYSCFGNSFTDKRNKVMISLMLDSGLRLSEVCDLRLEALHPDEHYGIVCGKGNKQRRFPIGLQSEAYLSDYLRQRPNGSFPHLFLKSDGTAVNQNTVKQLFRKLKHNSYIARLHPHLLRHTFATRYLENGGNIYSLQIILGHTSLEMVKRYLHLANNRIWQIFALG